MKIKELIQQSYEDLLSLQVSWYNVLLLLLIVFLLSSITTPIIGVPVGLLGGGYFLKRQEEKNK